LSHYNGSVEHTIEFKICLSFHYVTTHEALNYLVAVTTALKKVDQVKTQEILPTNHCNDLVPFFEPL
jgi:hypothetical protein